MKCRNKVCFVVLSFLAAVSFAGEQGMKFMPGKKVGTIQSDLIQEASGIVTSRKNASVLWVHNDSGNSPKIYAINPSGELLGAFGIKDTHCRDWEDIAIGPGPEENRDYLYIGDIGDNKAKYPAVTVYRVPEPNVDNNRDGKEFEIGPAEGIELVYPDGPKDAETLLIDPITKDIYVISKRSIFSKVYLAPYPQSIEKPTKLILMSILPWGLATGGDVSRDGRLVIVRGLTSASIWHRPEGKPLWDAFEGECTSIELMPEPQGEAVCFDADMSGFFTLSEKPFQPIYYFRNVDSKEDPNRK